MTIFVFLGILLIVSLILIAIEQKLSRRREERFRLKTQLSRRTVATRKQLRLLSRLGAPDLLIRELSRDLVEQMQQLITLETQNPPLQALLAEDLAFCDALLSDAPRRKIDCIANSPEEFAAMVMALKEAGDYVALLTKTDRIQGSAATELMQSLARLTLDVEIFNHLATVGRAIEHKERLTAQNHLKHARESLRNASIDVSGKKQLVQILSDRLKRLNQQSVILTDNPEEKPEPSTKKKW